MLLIIAATAGQWALSCCTLCTVQTTTGRGSPRTSRGSDKTAVYFRAAGFVTVGQLASMRSSRGNRALLSSRCGF